MQREKTILHNTQNLSALHLLYANFINTNHTCVDIQESGYLHILHLSVAIWDKKPYMQRCKTKEIKEKRTCRDGSNTTEREPGTTLPSKKVTSLAVTSCQGPRSSLLLAEPKAQVSHSAPAMQQAGTTAGLEEIDIAR